MRNIVSGVPIKTRVPMHVWALAATVTLLSFATSVVADKSDGGGKFLLAAAQTAPQGQDAPGPDNGAEPIPDLKPGDSLSDHLGRNQGVITPPPTGDPGIYTDAPNPNPGTTPVIPPPGTPGGPPIQPN